MRTQALGFLAAGISGTVLNRWLPVPAGLGLSGTMAYLSAGGTYVPAGSAFKPSSSALMVPVLRSSNRFGTGLQLDFHQRSALKRCPKILRPRLGSKPAEHIPGTHDDTRQAMGMTRQTWHAQAGMERHEKLCVPGCLEGASIAGEAW